MLAQAMAWHCQSQKPSRLRKVRKKELLGCPFFALQHRYGHKTAFFTKRNRAFGVPTCSFAYKVYTTHPARALIRKKPGQMTVKLHVKNVK